MLLGGVVFTTSLGSLLTLWTIRFSSFVLIAGDFGCTRDFLYWSVQSVADGIYPKSNQVPVLNTQLYQE